MTGAQWADWWCCTWRWMHPGWQSRLTAEQGMDPDTLARLSRSRHADVLTCLGVTPAQPPQPQVDVIRWLAMSDEQRLLAASLVEAICFATPAAQGAVSDEQWSWCRGLAKALRPGVWLAGEHLDARSMLGAWLGDIYWTRLRLGWPPEVSLALALNLPARKLDALWGAVFWKVLT